MEVRLQYSISNQSKRVFFQIENLIEGNCIQGGRLLLDYHISIELQSLLYQTVKIRVIVNMSAECIACQNPIRARQQGLRFDSCFRRQHRTCGAGIPV